MGSFDMKAKFSFVLSILGVTCFLFVPTQYSSVWAGTSGEYRKALATYDRVVAANPKDAVVVYNRGLVHFHLKHYKRAVVDFNRAVALDPNKAEFFNARGGVRLIESKYQDAIDDFKLGLAIQPDNAILLENLRRALLAQDRLLRVTVNDRFVAAAITADLRIGSATHWASQSAAEAWAFALCRQTRQICQLAGWAKNGCFSIAVNAPVWVFSWGPTVQESDRAALDSCASKVGGSCTVVRSECSQAYVPSGLRSAQPAIPNTQVQSSVSTSRCDAIIDSFVNYYLGSSASGDRQVDRLGTLARAHSLAASDSSIMRGRGRALLGVLSYYGCNK